MLSGAVCSFSAGGDTRLNVVASMLTYRRIFREIAVRND